MIESVPTTQSEDTTSVREKGLLRPVNFDPEKCKCNLGKAQKLQPKDGEMILDTGDFETIGTGDCYVETIEAGVVDHHRLDNVFRARGQVLDPRCSAKIIATYAEDVSRMIEARGVHTTLAHADGDLDSIVSSYLAQSLIQRKELPVGATKLAEHVNRVDYGMYRETDIEKYLLSLSGIFSAIKSELANERDGELGKEVFGNPEMKAPNGRLNDAGVQKLNEIKTKFENLLSEKMFEVLNEIEKAAAVNPEFDPEKDMALVLSGLAPEVQEIIERGKSLTRKELEVFNQDFEQAERTTIKVKVPKTGESIEVPIIIALEPKTVPTAFTNISYQRITPDTIVAVYGGAGRKGGDMYDIGIKQESAALIDMGELCVALNRAEKEKRDQLASDDPIRITLDAQPDRIGMSGPEQVLTKDPTVLVAGGTLIAATRSSLLSAEDFKRVVSSLQ